MELEAFLEQQRQSGEEDSEGHFTLALQQASWKLSEFLLTDKELYPLFLLSCAVRGGATSFKVNRHPAGRSDTFVFDGEPITATDLERLALPLGGPDAKVRIRDLGTVLNVATLLGTVTLVSNSGKHGLSLDIGEDKVAQVTKSDFDEPQHGQMLTVSYYEWAPIKLDTLESAGRFAPLEFAVDGRNCREVIDFGMDKGKLFGHYLNQGLGSFLVRSPKYSKRPVSAHSDTLKDKRTIAVGLCTPAFAEKFQWKILVSGVVMEDLPLRESDPPFVCGVVDASHLKTDISGRALIKDQAYKELWHEIDAAVDKVLVGFCEDPVKVPGKYLPLFQAELYRRYESQEMPASVSSYLLRTMRVDPNDPESLKRLGERGRKSEDWETVEGFLRDFRQRASAAYSKNAIKQVRKWLKCEQKVLQAAKKSTSEVIKLLGSVNYLHKSGKSDRDLSFRSLLTQLGDLNEEELSVFLLSEDERDGWKTPLNMLVARQDGRESDGLEPTTPWAFAFSVWDLCEKRDFSTVRIRIADLKSKSEAQTWRLAVLRLYRGAMPFLESSRWQIAHNLTQHFSAGGTFRKAMTLLEENPDNWEVDQELMNRGGLESVWIPLVMSRLIFLSRMGRKSAALRFLGMVLLQASLLEDGILTGGELPKWEKAFPVRRLRLK